MTPQQFNEIFRDLQNMSRYTLVASEGMTKIYDLGIESLFLKVEMYEDSYGEEYLTRLQLVKPVIKKRYRLRKSIIMTIQRVNELLALFLEDKGAATNVELISTDESADYYEEKNQEDEGLKVEIWDINDPEVFVKVRKATDSYGDNERVTEIKFVTKSTKNVTVYE